CPLDCNWTTTQPSTVATRGGGCLAPLYVCVCTSASNQSSCRSARASATVSSSGCMGCGVRPSGARIASTTWLGGDGQRHSSCSSIPSATIHQHCRERHRLKRRRTPGDGS